MALIEGTIEIKSPIDKVFTYVTEAKSWPKWHAAMLKAEQTSSGQIVAGATCHGTNRIMGRAMEWNSKVTECEPNKIWKEDITSGSTHIKESLKFTPIESGTKFTLIYDMKVDGFLKLFSPIMASMMRKELRGNLNTLRTILETGK